MAGTTKRLIGADGCELVLRAFTARLTAGGVIGVWYSDDKVWHERLFLFKYHDGSWDILTPDRDRYREYICADRTSEGPSKAFLCSPGSGPWFSVGSFYRFAADDYPDDAELKTLVLAARKDSLVASRAAGKKPIPDPHVFVNSAGELKPWRLLVGKRRGVPGKRDEDNDASDADEEDGGDMSSSATKRTVLDTSRKEKDEGVRLTMQARVRVTEGLGHLPGRSGASGLRRGIAFAPSQARFLSAELAKDTEILKQQRKAREEEGAAKAQPGPDMKKRH